MLSGGPILVLKIKALAKVMFLNNSTLWIEMAGAVSGKYLIRIRRQLMHPC